LSFSLSPHKQSIPFEKVHSVCSQIQQTFSLISFQEKKNFGSQYVFQTEESNAATQATGHYHCSSSEPEEFEVDTNKDDETDADWTPSAEKWVIIEVKLKYTCII
jgi:hypothetical protein